ncbi:MAG TPA: hypothetical protein VFJ90_09590 [Candidatus Didemnitutus sp.]|nr:hypothetical protein [Candidatus Didemnitutus sp.]
MHTRLLSFLSDFERTLQADDPSPSDGSWSTLRTVNFHLGLARLILGVQLPAGGKEARGSLFLQSYQLADGTPCLRVALAWTGASAPVTRVIYSQPETNWLSEARRVAAEWMGGPPAKVEVAPAEDIPSLAAEAV